MNTNLVEIRESDLQLVVEEKTLGSLTTNAKKIRDLVKLGLSHYDIANYDESNIDLAKKDKALLNVAAKSLNAKRLEFEREFMSPFNEFKDIINETVKLIGDCSAKIDVVVKQSEEKAKDEKLQTIRQYWDEKAFLLVSFDKIFDSKWINKTKKLNTIYEEINSKIVKINDDITTLEAIGEDVDLLKSLYLDTLNINSTIQYANTLKQNRERAKAAAERATATEVPDSVPVVSDSVPVVSDFVPDFVPDFIPDFIPIVNDIELLTRAFKVTTTREKIIALGDFMNDNDINFEKIEL
jgi:hypothetical protein